MIIAAAIHAARNRTHFFPRRTRPCLLYARARFNWCVRDQSETVAAACYAVSFWVSGVPKGRKPAATVCIYGILRVYTIVDGI